jgi:hypothetical protein
VDAIKIRGLSKIYDIGILDYSVSNNLIVVFPQAKYDYNNTCWDVNGIKHDDKD